MSCVSRVCRDGDRFGASIAFLGDLNKDGHPEIAVGSPMSDIYTGLVSSDMGSVYQLELLPSKPHPHILLRFLPLSPRGSFTQRVADRPLILTIACPSDRW